MPDANKDQKAFWAEYLKAVTQDSSGDQQAVGAMAAPTSLLADFDNKDEKRALYQAYELGDLVPNWGLAWDGNTTASFFQNYHAFVDQITPQAVDEKAAEKATEIYRKLAQIQDAKTQLHDEKQQEWMQDNCQEPSENGKFCRVLVDGAPTWQATWAKYQKSDDYQNKLAILASMNSDELAGLRSDYTETALRAYGPGYQQISETITACDLADPQLSSESDKAKTYRMDVAINDTDEWVPRYITDDLAQYTAWLKQTKEDFTNAVSPKVQMAFSNNTTISDETHWKFAFDVGVPVETFFWLGAKGGGQRESIHLEKYSFTATMAYQDTYLLHINPGPWFNGGLLSQYSDDTSWAKGSQFRGKPIWGPHGIPNLLNTRVTGVYIGVGAYVKIDITDDNKDEVHSKWRASGSFGIGPMNFESASASGGSNYSKDEFLQNGYEIKDSHPYAHIVALAVETPNFPARP
ncbi:hypothetical protein [Actinoalloteichus hymeniacidonis]|uniref:Uncharacterized protein n=1 Tax=Actinoalloteichus hymeniacidonis TaxID=340345 RepID=A0AAC9HT87_9PSEU|nr:hypothetical protein [Actinoalloteichus hymeniacidonis]AOS64521.1 hypothetical protein TL08_18630 [Actinoalloteichus hymeniacidonis]MBB5907407.1 hypothetical protein [Actinoalloteichus hymeniacidonis]